MNKSILLSFACITVFISSFGQSQSEMNLEEYSNYKKAEKEINTVYQKILMEYSSKTEFVNNLKASQRLWIQFRDAELKARYPDKEEYGSVMPMCKSIFLTQMTNDRIETLKVWLRGIPEGDVCSGSVKVSGEGVAETSNNEGSSSSVKSFGVRVINMPAQSIGDEIDWNGKIAMDIVTDVNGKVISATYQPRGSTTSNPQMISIARKKAFELRNLRVGEGAQKGTVIINFKARG